MSGVLTIFRDAVIVAIGGAIVTGIILAGKVIHTRSIARRNARFIKEAERDETLRKVGRVLDELQRDQKVMGEDIRCLYPIQLVQLESLEISLMAIHGDGLNGNVGDAITLVRETKRSITDRLVGKIGCQDMGEVD